MHDIQMLIYITWVRMVLLFFHNKKNVLKKEFLKKQRGLLNRINKQKKIIEEEKKKKDEFLIKQQKIEKGRASAKKVRVEKFKQTPLGTALTLLKAKKYDEAYEKLYELFLKNTSNARINFYLGLSATGAKLYDEAVSAFERVLIVDPKHIRARLELARALFFLKMFDESEKEFLKVLENDNLPKNIFLNIEKFLIAIEATRIRNHYNAAVMVGIQYDTNINNDVGENNYVIDPEVISGGVKGENAKSDLIHQEMANLNHIYDFGKLGDFFMQNSFTLFTQNYISNTEKNILFYSLSTGIGANKQNYTMSSKLHFDNVQVNSVALMSVIGVDLGLTKPLNNTIVGNTKIKYQMKSFVDTPDNDSTFYELDIGAKKSINDKKDKITGNIIYSSESAKDAPSIDKDIMGIKLGYSKIFDEKNIVNSTLTYKSISYTKKSRNQNWEMAKRSDSQLNLTIGNSYKLDKTKIINGSFSYLDNVSTHSAFKYNKILIGANILILF